MSQNHGDESGIDKFDGSFEAEESGCTIFVNKTVNSIKKLDVGGLYLYLTCRPSSWKLNVKHLAATFDCNKEKIYNIIDTLIEMNLLTRTEIRIKGKFCRYHYRVHLRPTNVKVECVQIDAPCLEKPDTVKPDTENPDAYKTKSVLNKETSLKDYSATTVAHTPAKDSFEDFWKIYPIKKNKNRAQKIWERKKYNKIAILICTDIANRLANEAQWQDKQYIPHASTYLNNERWNDEVIYRRPKQASQGNGSFSNVMYGSSTAGATYDEHGNDINPFN